MFEKNMETNTILSEWADNRSRVLSFSLGVCTAPCRH